jgi:flavodoxin
MRLFKGLVTGMVVLFAGQLFAADIAQSTAGKPSSLAKKVLVVYYSRTGNTKKVAEDVARMLNADIEQLIDKKDRSGAGGYMVAGKDAATEKLTEIEPAKNDPAKYDMVVIGTPVWAWNMTPAVRTYIANNKAAIKKVAFFTSAGGTKPDKIVSKMETLAGKKAIASAGFFDSDHKEKNRARYEEKLNTFVASLK